MQQVTIKTTIDIDCSDLGVSVFEEIEIDVCFELDVNNQPDDIWIEKVHGPEWAASIIEDKYDVCKLWNEAKDAMEENAIEKAENIFNSFMGESLSDCLGG